MPLYEYECSDCGHLTEVLQRMSAPPLVECPRCGGRVKKLLSAPAFQFKGSGWYVTDYARKGDGAAGKEPKGDSGSGGEKPAASDGAAKGEKTGETATAGKSGKSSSGPSAD